MSNSLAASIPEELFERIVWHVGHGYGLYPIPPQVKKALSTCASVCHYWSTLCRPKLFFSITLKSKQDLLACRELLNIVPPARFPPIATFVQRLQAAPDGTEQPWLHLIPLVVLPKLDIQTVNYHHYVVDASKLRTTKTMRFRSLHSALPRTLPSCYSPITNLELSNAHFLDGAELVKLLSGLPTLRSLDLINITWAAPPDASTFLSLPISEQDTQVQTTGCAEGMSALWFLPALLARRGRRPAPSRRRAYSAEFDMRPDAFRVVLDLLHALLTPTDQPPSSSAAHEWHVHRGAQKGEYQAIQIGVWGYRVGPGHEKLMPYISIMVRPPPPSRSRGLPPGCTYGVHILWWLDKDPVPPSDDALRSFSEIALRLPGLEYVTHEFDSRTSASHFLAKYGAVVKPLSEAGKLRCLWRNAEDGVLHRFPVGPAIAAVTG